MLVPIGLAYRTLTLGFILQVIDFSMVILSLLGVTSRYIGIALIVMGRGCGIAVFLVIKAVVEGIHQRHARLLHQGSSSRRPRSPVRSVVLPSAVR
jgi:hypothetical protein